MEKFFCGKLSAERNRCRVGATSCIIRLRSNHGLRIGRVREICLCAQCAPIQWLRRKRPHYNPTVRPATFGAVTLVAMGSSRTQPFGLIVRSAGERASGLRLAETPQLRREAGRGAGARLGSRLSDNPATVPTHPRPHRFLMSGQYPSSPSTRPSGGPEMFRKI